MKEKDNNLSVQDRYEIAKKEKPNLGSLVDQIEFEKFPFMGHVTNTLSRKQFESIFRDQRLKILELCKKDVKLNTSQKEVLNKVLSHSLIGFGFKKTDYLAGEWLVSKENNDSLLIAATYINSL